MLGGLGFEGDGGDGSALGEVSLENDQVSLDTISLEKFDISIRKRLTDFNDGVGWSELSVIRLEVEDEAGGVVLSGGDSEGDSVAGEDVVELVFPDRVDVAHV